jgi:hypothetical protein
MDRIDIDRIGRCWSAAAVALCAILLSAPIFDARAQESPEHNITVAPGKDVRFGVYTDIRPDCGSGPLPGVRLVTPPAHGTVSVKRGTLKATNFKQCLGLDVPAFVGFYRAADGFNGADAFEVEITPQNGAKQRQVFHVTVSSDAKDGGKGI